MKVSLLIFGAVVLFSGALKADVVYTIYDNFGANQSFDPSFGLNLNHFGTGVAFTPTDHSYLLDEIDFVASLNSQVPLNPIVGLYSDDNGLPSTTLLESFTFTGQLGTLDVNAAITQLHSVSHPLLIHGQKYWVVLTDPNIDDNVGDIVWNVDGNGALGRATKETGQWAYGDSYQQGSLAVQGTIAPVPEPGTMLLLGCGLAGFAALRRRRTA